MVKLKSIIPVIIVLVMVGVGAYAYFSGGKVTLNGNSVSISKTTSTSSESLTGTLQAIMAKGKTVKCSYAVAGNNYEGYIKGNMYRGKADMKDQGVADIIMKDNCMWSWSDKTQTMPGGYQGTKMCFGEGSSMFNQNSGIRPDIEYKCSPAIISDDYFTPPTTIKFYDLDTQGFGIDTSAENQ